MAFRNWKQELEDVRPRRKLPWGFIRRVATAAGAVAALAACALWVWPGYLLARPWQRPGPAPRRLTLVFASDVAGYLEPCGCTEQRWGGIARAGGYLKAARREVGTLLAFDASDMTAGTQRWQRLAWACYLKALGRMRFAAANVGAAELALSATQLRAAAEDSPVPLVSANVTDAAGKPAVRTHVAMLADNLRVTAVGVVVPPAGAAVGEGLAVRDAGEALGELLPKLRGSTDVIVLLASCDEEAMRRLAAGHPEIDVVLGGRVQQATAAVQTVGNCRLAWQAKKGQLLGRMDVEVRPDGRPGAAAATMVLLDNDVPEDAELLAFVERYNAELAELDRAGGLKALGVPVAPVPAGAVAYAGSAACKDCHVSAGQRWSKFAHSRAYASLVKRRRDSNPDCIRCHVVDFAAGDGFCGVEASPDRMNVQCESCHGRAGDHVLSRKSRQDAKVGRLAKVLPASCETCHDCFHSPQFTYPTYWPRIAHGQDTE